MGQVGEINIKTLAHIVHLLWMHINVPSLEERYYTFSFHLHLVIWQMLSNAREAEDWGRITVYESVVLVWWQIQFQA